MSELIEEIPVEDSPVLTKKEAEEKGILGRGAFIEKDTGELNIGVQRKDKPKPLSIDDEKKVISADKKTEVIAPKLITEPLNVGERKGIVTPSKEIVREPIGKGVVGLKEKEVIAPPANLTDRVPVGVDIFGRDKYGTLEKEGLEDIKRQKTPLSYDEFKQKVMSGEITRASKYSSPQALKIITQTLQNENADPNLKELQDRRLRTFYNYSQYKDPSKKTIIAFTEEEKFKGKEGDNPRLNNSKKQFADNKLEFYEVIKNKFTNFENVKDQRRIEQKLLDRISTGNSAKSVLRVGIERINEIPRVIPTMLPYAKYIYDFGLLGTNAELWEATRKEREATVQKIKESVQSEVNIPLLMDVMNEAIEEGLKIDMEKGEISKEKFEQLTQVKVGDTIYKRQFVNEDLAMKVLDESFKKLTDSQKIGVYLFETSPTLGIAGPVGKSLAAARSKESMAQLRNLVSKKFTPKEVAAYNKLPDVEFLFSMKQLDLAEMKDIKSLVKSINVKALEDSIKLDVVSKNAKKLMQRAYQAGVKYRSLKNDPTATQAQKTSALVQYRRLYAQTVNDAISLRSSPILREGIKEIAPLVAAQYVGGEYFTPQGQDTFTGELYGIATYLFARGSNSIITGRIVKTLDGWGGGVANTAAKTFEDLTSFLYRVTGGKVEDAMLKGWLANRTKEDYEQLLGYRLSKEDVKSLEWTQNLVKYMGEENATIAMQNIRRDFELRTKVANLFPETLAPGEKGMTRDEAMALFIGDIGQTSKVMWLQSARMYSQRKLGAFDGNDPVAIQQSIEYQKSLEASVTAQTKILDRILENARIQGMDFRNNAIAQDYIMDLERRINYTKSFNKQFAIDLKEKINGYIDKIELNPNESSKAGLIQELKKAEIDITEIAEGKVLNEFDELKLIDDQVKDSFANLKESTDIIKSNRANITKHGEQTAKTTEKLIDTQIVSRLQKGRAGFQKLDQEMIDSNQFIDMSKLVRSLVDESEEFKDKPLSLFFSKQKEGLQFFGSQLNKNLYKSFRMMAQRSLKNMPEDLRNKLEVLATIKPTSDKPNPFYIADNINDFDEFDLVLKIADNADNPDLGLQNFKPFVATAYEVNAVRTSFRNYAYRLKDTEPELASQYAKRKDELDDLFAEKMPEKAQEYENARKRFKAFVYDETDIENDFNTIQSGIKRTDEDPEGLNFIYKENKGPEILFNNVSNTALKFVKTDDDVLLGNLKRRFKKEARGFQDKTDNFTPVFDLTTPQGVDKLNVFKSLLKEKLYTTVGREYFTIDTKTVAGQRKIAMANRNGGYLFDDGLDAKIAKLDDVFEVDIIDVGGEKTTLSLNPLADLIEESADITVHVARNAEVQTKLKNYLGDLKRKVESQKEIIMNKKTALLDDLQEVSRKLGDNTFEATPSGFKRFFEKNVIGGTVARIESDKKFIMQSTGFSRERVDELYEFMIGNGLLEMGQRNRVAGSEFMGLDGKQYTYEVFDAPQNIIDLLQVNKNSKEILDTVLSTDHQKNIASLMELVNGRMKLSKTDDLTTQSTVIRKITHNELASRGYNIARGMVSPLYVATEFGLRIASQSGINIMNLAVNNERAAELMLMVFENPQNMTKADISMFNELVQSFIVEQITRQGLTVPEFTEEGLQSFREQIEEEKKKEKTDETVQ